MRHCFILLSTAVFLQSHPLSAADQIVVLGDSLSYAYEAEFGFEIEVQTNLGSSETFGDGFGSEVRNWIEILSDPAFRGDRFDMGARDDITLQTFIIPERFEELYFRQEGNWSVPGYRIDQLRRFVFGEATITGILGENPEFADLEVVLENSDFEESDFAVEDLVTQVQTTAERVVLFIGGNDINAVYGTIYDGGSAGSFAEDFIDDATLIIDWIQGHNPDIQIVLVNVPHVGITPDVQSRFPTDAVKTARVTAVLQGLNAQLASLSIERGIGYADVFSSTLRLLDPAPLCIHGISFENSGSTSGDTDFVWLNGELSFNFHPNTSAQALIANTIVEAFNARYGTGIAPLDATELLSGLLGKSSQEIDMPFAEWIACHGLPGVLEGDDTDLDGMPAGLEFALGLDPTVGDSEHVTVNHIDNGGSPALEIAYPVRLPGSARVTLTPASTPTLDIPFTAFGSPPVPGSDGLARAILPITGDMGFLRIEANISP